MDDVFVNDISVLEVQEEGRQLELKSRNFIENCSVSGCHELSIVFKCAFLDLPGGEEKRILVFEKEEFCSSIAQITCKPGGMEV